MTGEQQAVLWLASVVRAVQMFEFGLVHHSPLKIVEIPAYYFGESEKVVKIGKLGANSLLLGINEYVQRS